MSTTKQLRYAAEAALAAWKTAQDDPTLTNSELKTLKRAADEAHAAWIAAVNEHLCGSRFDVSAA